MLLLLTLSAFVLIGGATIGTVILIVNINK